MKDSYAYQDLTYCGKEEHEHERMAGTEIKKGNVLFSGDKKNRVYCKSIISGA